MTHADVAEHLAEKGFDQATAYRNLIALTEAELLRRSDLVTMCGDSNRSERASMHMVLILTLCVSIVAAYPA